MSVTATLETSASTYVGQVTRVHLDIYNAGPSGTWPLLKVEISGGYIPVHVNTSLFDFDRTRILRDGLYAELSAKETGTTAAVDMEVTSSEGGAHTLKALIWSQDVDPNPGNNEAQVTWNADVPHGPDLWADNYRSWGHQSLYYFPHQNVHPALTVFNGGDAPSAPTSVSYYFSPTDRVQDTSDTLLLTRKIPAIRAGGHVVLRPQFGHKYRHSQGYLLDVIDPDNKVPEADENNNLETLGPL